MITVRLEIKDRSVRDAMEAVISSRRFLVQRPGDQTPCDLMIMEIGLILKMSLSVQVIFRRPGLQARYF